MRLFLSCKIPENICSYLKEVTKKLPTAKLTIPKQFDLTIKFFGEVSEEVMAELSQRLSLLQFPSFETTLEKLGVFTERRIRTAWVGVTPKDPFFALHDAVEKILMSLTSHDERFFPHITLARIKAVSNRKEFLQGLNEIHIDPLIFKVDELLLIQSKILQEGAEHTPLFTYKLH